MSDPGDLCGESPPNFVLSPKQPSAGSSEDGESDTECREEDQNFMPDPSPADATSQSIEDRDVSIATEYNETSEFCVKENSLSGIRRAEEPTDGTEQGRLDKSQILQETEENIEVRGLGMACNSKEDEYFGAASVNDRVEEHNGSNIVDDNDNISDGVSKIPEDDPNYYRNSQLVSESHDRTLNGLSDHKDNVNCHNIDDNIIHGETDDCNPLDTDDHSIGSGQVEGDNTSQDHDFDHINNINDRPEDDNSPDDDHNNYGSSDNGDGNDRAEDELDEVEVVSQSENAEADQHLEMESAESEQLHHHGYLAAAIQQRDEPEGQQQDVDLPGAQGFNQQGLQDRHEPVRQWVLNIDPNPHPEDEQMFDLSFSSDQGTGVGLLQGSMHRPGLSNSNPDLSTGNRRGYQPFAHAVNFGTTDDLPLHNEQDRAGPTIRNTENAPALQEVEFNERVEDNGVMSGIGQRVEYLSLQQNTDCSGRVRNSELREQSAQSPRNRRDAVEDPDDVSASDREHNHDYNSVRNPMESPRQFRKFSEGFSNSNAKAPDSLDNSNRPLDFGSVSSPQVMKNAEVLKTGEKTGSNVLLSNTKQKMNRHEQCVVSGPIKSSQGAVSKQRSSSLPRPQKDVLNRAPGVLKSRATASQNSHNRSSEGQQSGRKEDGKRATQRSTSTAQRSLSTAQRAKGASVRGRQQQQQNTRTEKTGGPPSMKKHLASQGVEISPIKSEEDSTLRKGEEPPEVSQCTAVTQTSLSASSSYKDSVKSTTPLPGQPTRPPGLDSVHQLLHGPSLHESTHTSIGHSEALDYMADVKQHLQAILQGSNQPIGHGNQLSGHGNQLSGHGSQFIGHGNQLSVHGNQPGRPGYQSHVGGHVTGHMTGQHGGSPISRHSFYSEGVTGNLDQLLSYSSKYLTDLPATPQSHGPLEVHLLRESLEKEQLRRKHCEQLIQDLQRKMLENQEQLAVAMEMDRKKDHMIKQLDKSLGSVVDKWKQSESDRQHRFDALQTEHEELKRVHLVQTRTLSKFESELQDTVNCLSAEKLKAQQNDRDQQDQLRVKTQELEACAGELALYRERTNTLTQECSGLTERLDRLHTQFAQLKEVYDEENLLWEQKEKKFNEELEVLKRKHQEEVEKFKREHAQTSERADEMETELSKCKTRNREMEVELDTAVREKESLKVQLGLQEARLESAQRRLEAELTQRYQRQIQEEVAAVKTEMVAMETQLQEKHHAQITELGRRNNKELSSQMSALRADMAARETRYREEEETLRQTISELQSDLEEQQEINRVMESQHTELANKLPALMQAHCDQALRLLQRGNLIHGPANDQRHVIGSSNPPATMTTSSITYTSGSVITSSSQFPLSSVTSRSLAGQEVMSRAVVGQADNDSRLQASQVTLSAVQDVANSSLFSSLAEDQVLDSSSHQTGVNSPLTNSNNRLGDGNALLEPRGIPVGSGLPNSTMATSHSRSNNSYNNPSMSHSNSNTGGLQSSQTNSYYGNAAGLSSNPVLPGSSNRSDYTNSAADVGRCHDNSYHSNNSLPPQPPGLQLRPVKYERDKKEDITNTSAVINFRDATGDRSVKYEGGKAGSNVIPTRDVTGQDSDQRDSQGVSPRVTSQVTPSTLFQNLSAQNHQGMEFIRRQLEQQTAQILLHPPASLDLSGLQEETGISQNASHTSHQGSSGSGSKVTWREGEDSFLSPSTDKNRSVDYSGMGEKFDQHEARQQELQRYIKMLLHKPPGSSADVSVSSDKTPHFEPSMGQDVAPPGDTRGGLNVDLTEQPIVERIQEGTDLCQSGRNAASTAPQMGHIEGSSEGPQPGDTGISMAEISHLLGMYKQVDNPDHKEMQDVMSYLHETHSNRFEPPVQPCLTPPSPSLPQGEYPPSPRKQPAKARRNLQATYNVTESKQSVAVPDFPSLVQKPKQSNIPSLDPQGPTKPPAAHIQAVRPMSLQQTQSNSNQTNSQTNRQPTNKSSQKSVTANKPVASKVEPSGGRVSGGKGVQRNVTGGQAGGVGRGLGSGAKKGIAKKSVWK